MINLRKLNVIVYQIYYKNSMILLMRVLFIGILLNKTRLISILKEI